MPASTAAKTRLRRIVVAAVILVPLTFTGLFVGTVGDEDQAAQTVPAALVNEDKLVYQDAPDGSRTPVFAGRQLVTELVADGSVDWTITNATEADRALKAGEVHAVLTIPPGFSESILSLGGDDPKQARLRLRTDDANSYLTGTLSDVVGAGLASTFGNAITAQYIAGIYSGMGELGDSLTAAADGATQLADGATGLSGGLGELASGIAATQGGAASLADGVTRYTAGVDGLSAGLQSLEQGSQGLTGIATGVAGYTGQVGQLAAMLAEANAGLAAAPGDPAAVAAVGELSSRLSQAAAVGEQLAGQTSAGVTQLRSAIGQSSAGAAQLSQQSGALRTGVGSLSGGLLELSTGASDAASGAGELATGASELARGLGVGVGELPTVGEDLRASAAEVVADPVGLALTRDNAIPEARQAVAAFVIPLGLWLGALAVFLVTRPVPSGALLSTASSGRLLRSALGRASLVTTGQALLLVALLHGALGVSWTLLSATLAFAVLTALAVTAIHHLLVSAFGRGGLVVSLMAVAVQVTSSGGLYPIEVLAAPYQLISPLMPLTYAVSGMQGILAGAPAATVVGSAVALIGFGVLSALISFGLIGRMRRNVVQVA